MELKRREPSVEGMAGEIEMDGSLALRQGAALERVQRMVRNSFCFSTVPNAKVGDSGHLLYMYFTVCT
jgi:hypothetical protein